MPHDVNACPLRSIRGAHVECCREICAFWLGAECAIPVIARTMSELVGMVVPAPTSIVGAEVSAVVEVVPGPKGKGKTQPEVLEDAPS